MWAFVIIVVILGIIGLSASGVLFVTTDGCTLPVDLVLGDTCLLGSMFGSAGMTLLGIIIVAIIGFIIASIVRSGRKAHYAMQSSDKKAEIRTKAGIKTIVQSMLAVCIADGEIQQEEVKVIQTVFYHIFGEPIEAAWVHETGLEMLNNNFNIRHTLNNNYYLLDHALKLLILKAAYLVAIADGRLYKTEEAVLLEIAHGLHLSDQDIRDILKS